MGGLKGAWGQGMDEKFQRKRTGSGKSKAVTQAFPQKLVQ